MQVKNYEKHDKSLVVNTEKWNELVPVSIPIQHSVLVVVSRFLPESCPHLQILEVHITSLLEEKLIAQV